MEWIKKLQNKPQKTKQRIMWVAVGVIMAFVITVWLLTISFKETSFLNLGKLIESELAPKE
jgi:hypothetical protein